MTTKSVAIEAISGFLTNEAQRTPGPWAVGQRNSDGWTDIQSADMSGNGDYVAEAYCEIDAAFIVRACNAHDDLVTALRETTRQLANLQSTMLDLGADLSSEIDDALVLAHAVLAKVEA